MSQQKEYLSQINRILQKLEQARSRRLTAPNSGSRDYRLKPPLSEADLQAFEAKEQIHLPEDYRLFLTHAGNGGAGPYSGLFSFNEWEDFADWVVDDRPEHFLALPCPLYQGMPRTEDWEKHFGDTSPYQGTLSLGSRGCAFATQLIVTGSYRGRVVYVDADGNEPPYIVHEPNFLSWYERWLDELLQGYNAIWFGYGPGGGEEDFLRILSDAEASDDFREEAARAFCRLPHLSEHAGVQISQYLSDPLAEVRAGVLVTIRHFHRIGDLARVEPLLEDSSAKVRLQAVYAVMKFDPQRCVEAVARRLREDSDEDVVRAAFSALKEANALTKAELLRLLGDPTRRRLRYQLVSTIAWNRGDETFLLPMLTDSDMHVRSCAMSSLKQIMGKDSLPHLIELLSREQEANIVGHILKALGEIGESSTVPILLEWVKSGDDFHRLDAMEALAKIGDERAVDPARAMLQEQRCPVRRDARGFASVSNIHTIRELVRQSLLKSPNPTLRQLAR